MPRIYVIIILATVSWAFVAGLGWLIWSVVT